MKDGPARNQQAAFCHEEARVSELQRYIGMADEDLEFALDKAQMFLDEEALPAMEAAEQEVREMEDLIAMAMALTPDMEDQLHEARLHWEAARARAQSAGSEVLDLEQAIFARDQAWSLTG